MLKSAIINYIIYIKQFFKCLAIISLSIIVFYIVFQISFHLPIKNADIEHYNAFIEAMELYISTITTEGIFSSDFLGNTLSDVLEIFRETNPDINIGTGLILLSALIIVGAFVLSQAFCRKAIRDDVKNRDTIPLFIQVLFKSFLNIVFWVTFFFITLNWFYAIILLPIVLVVGEAFKVLIYTWFVYFRKYRITQVVNIRNSIRLVFTNAVLMYLHSLLFIYLSPYLSLYMLLLLALSFFAYASTITEFTATRYFLSERKQRHLEIA